MRPTTDTAPPATTTFLHLADLGPARGLACLDHRGNIADQLARNPGYSRIDTAATGAAYLAAINTRLAGLHPAATDRLTVNPDGTVTGRADYPGNPEADLVTAIDQVDGPDGRGFWRLAAPHVVADPEFTAAVNHMAHTLSVLAGEVQRAGQRTGDGFVAVADRIRVLCAARQAALDVGRLDELARAADARRAHPKN